MTVLSFAVVCLLKQKTGSGKCRGSKIKILSRLQVSTIFGKYSVQCQKIELSKVSNLFSSRGKTIGKEIKKSEISSLKGRYIFLWLLPIFFFCILTFFSALKSLPNHNYSILKPNWNNSCYADIPLF